MPQLLPDYQAWAGFFTLTGLEVVLGIDNVFFLAIVWGGLPKCQQLAARRIGLALAVLARTALLFLLAWLIGLTEPILFSFATFDASSRDVVLVGGGLFLLGEGTTQIHHLLEGHAEEPGLGMVRFSSAMVEMLLLDAVFALEALVTAVGTVDQLAVMAAALTIAMVVMLVAAGPVGGFVERHPTVKMLALSFLLLVGTALVADGLHFHIPRGYLYFALALAVAVEGLHVAIARARRKRRSEDDAPG
jgi:predicted tellurium resistance membrane protein TerC